jgi:formylglycine-generating enzyme required for sulfatase activity
MRSAPRLVHAAALASAVSFVLAGLARASAEGPDGTGGAAPAASSGSVSAPSASARGPSAGAPPEAEGEDPAASTASPTATPSKPSAVARLPSVVAIDGMVRVPGGRFVIGSAERGAPANERPARGVEMPPFWIDRTEVTVAAYRACVERGACARPSASSTACTYDAGEPELPINCVGWSLAQTFCSAAGKRLPREAEWEAAARGTLGQRYPWGNAYGGCGGAVTLVKDGSQRSCVARRPAKVGGRLAGASPYGVLDMSGNVEEWVADWYAESAAELSPLAGASHVLRGGGWLSPPSLSRATTRNWGSVREAGANVGFRCARDDGQERTR